MAGLRVSDHALVRFLDRAGGLDVEELRARLAESLQQAHDAARSVSHSDFIIKADGLVYLVRDETVVTVLDDKTPRQTAMILKGARP